MILSWTNRFLFLKGRKIGGTSLEMALSPLCGPMDIITSISPEDERERRKNACWPQNHLGVMYDIEEEVIKTKRNFYNHITFPEIAHLFGYTPERFNYFLQELNFFIFTLDRHPYEKVMSQAAYIYKDFIDIEFPFEEAVNRVLETPGAVPLNYPIYTYDNKLIDGLTLFRYEPQGFKKIEESLGIQIPNAKENPFPKESLSLTDSQKEEINSLFYEEFQLFQWSKNVSGYDRYRLPKRPQDENREQSRSERSRNRGSDPETKGSSTIGN